MSAQAKQTSRGRKAKTTDVNLELRTQYRRATKAMIATGKAKEGDLVPVETLHFDGGTQQNVKTTINALDVAINGLNDKQLSNVSPKLREQYKGLIVEMGAAADTEQANFEEQVKANKLNVDTTRRKGRSSSVQKRKLQAKSRLAS